MFIPENTFENVFKMAAILAWHQLMCYHTKACTKWKCHVQKFQTFFFQPQCALPTDVPLFAKLLLTHRGLDKMAAPLADDIFQCISLNENFLILNKISLKYVPQGLIDNMAALVQIMAWRRKGDKPLSEPMLLCCTDASFDLNEFKVSLAKIPENR